MGGGDGGDSGSRVMSRGSDNADMIEFSALSYTWTERSQNCAWLGYFREDVKGKIEFFQQF